MKSVAMISFLFLPATFVAVSLSLDLEISVY